MTSDLQFVQEAVKRWDGLLETLASTCTNDNLVDWGALIEWVAAHDLPVIEGALWEGLATSVGAELLGETEGLVHGQVGADGGHWGTWFGDFLDNLTTFSFFFFSWWS
eukprot:TRINITY_DN103722_c0_g1_i1.p3 TRINITY_DN103722_c0_g1~~TRINITY_DN103722_c0_g1_i1.p3  ORF type:complete len:108 (-),score=16.84 TRINITY_DN103722_c0_g1_i1:11-334(-)